jgi:hypothetical protein
MQSSSAALPPSALLLWADSLPHRLVVPACHAENVQNFGAYQNIGACLKFTDFCQTTPVSISAHRRQKIEKHKYSLSLSNISFYTHDLQIRGCPRDPPLWPHTVEMGCGWWGGEEGGALRVPPSTCLAGRWKPGYARRIIHTASLSYQCLFLLLHLPLSRSTICAEHFVTPWLQGVLVYDGVHYSVYCIKMCTAIRTHQNIYSSGI